MIKQQQLAAGITLTAHVAGCWTEAGVDDYGEVKVLRYLLGRRLDAQGAVSLRELSHGVDPLWSRGRTERVVDRLLARGLIVDGQRAKKKPHGYRVADSVVEGYRRGIGPAIWRLAIDYRTSWGVAETLAPTPLPDAASMKRVLKFELAIEGGWCRNAVCSSEYSVGLARQGREATRERHLRILESGPALAVTMVIVTLELRGRTPVSERELIVLCGIDGSVCRRVLEELTQAGLIVDEREEAGHRHQYSASERRLITAAYRHLDVLDELVNSFIETTKPWTNN